MNKSIPITKTITPVLGLLLCLGSASLWAAEPAEAKEREKMAGVWKGFTVEGRGEQPDRGPVKLELRITEKEIAGLEFKGDKVIDHGKGAYVLDLTKSPAVLDAAKVNEFGRKQEFVGIYTLEGDTLRWCVSPRKVRPKEFRTGDGGYLLILKRQPRQQIQPRKIEESNRNP
ncbi:MAG: TIGR03067 domain-containing protein [Verrucomicrobia bacterium]|nr:TIGR03067 domain-containing protein [Verrucomicrobiota bacterium]